MNQEDLIRMARKAGWEYADGDRGFEPLWRFAALVAAEEREACAKVADLVAREIDDTNGTTTYIAAAIRARGQK